MSDDTILDIGKFKGLTFKEIFDNHKSYCLYVKENSDSYGFKGFAEYLSTKSFLEDLKNIKGITATKLIVYLMDIKEIKDIVDRLNSREFIQTRKFSPLRYRKTKKVAKISPQVVGQFVDYYFRYFLSEEGSFKDKRCEKVISTCKHIAEIYGSIDYIEYSYKRMKEGIADINDILNVSLSHSIFFNEFSALEYLNMESVYVDVRLDNYIREFNSNFIKNKVFTNIPLSVDKIEADCDIISNLELIEIKTGKHRPKDILQCLLYCTLVKIKAKRDIKKIIITNPLYSNQLVFDVDPNDIKTIFEQLKKYKLVSDDRTIEDIKTE